MNEIYEFPALIRETAVSDHPALNGIENPFVRSAEISSDRLDAYYTHMDPETTLRNYADEARAGVSVLDSHDARKLGVGYSFTGNVSPGDDGAVIVLSDFYMVHGIEFGGEHSYRSTDDYIRAVEARLVREISVGFYGDRQICDICGERYYSWDCPHIGGVEYPIGEQGARTVIATSTIYDAHLAEYSLVYKGATPGAQIRKIEREIKEGRLTGDSIAMLERRYRIKLPEKSKSFLVNGRKAESEVHMDLEKAFDKIRAILAETPAPEGVEVAEAVRWLAGEVERLKPLADAGRQYRADLIEQALAEGTRALGDDFQRESYQGMLQASSLDVIKRMAADWKTIGDKRFPGGRVTQDEQQQAPERDERQLVPDEAYS